jgi:hypothetical protein
MKEAFAAGFYEWVTPKSIVAMYFALVIFLLGVTLPIVGVTKSNAKASHRDAARVVAEQLSSMVETELSQMYAAAKLVHGFAAAAANLTAPDYAHDTAAQRRAIAMQSARNGILDEEAWYRLVGTVQVMYKGMRNVLLQPGVVNVFTTRGSTTQNRDWLNNSKDITAEYFYMVSTLDDSIYGPIQSADHHAIIAVRQSIWNTTKFLSKDRNNFDPVTGWHVNWRWLWGALSVVMDLNVVAEQSEFCEVIGDNFDFLFEALPHLTSASLNTVYQIIATSPTASVGDFDGSDDAVVDCVDRPGYENLCFRVIPRTRKWAGDDIATALLTATLAEVFAPLAFFAIILALARIVLGPRPNQFLYAPMKTPFYACCVDMVSAIRFWSEVPFIMHEVTMTFTKQLELTAKEHRVFIAMRLGNTAIVVSTRRSRVMHFAQAMNQWSSDYEWPGHVAVHCPNNTIAFSYMLHAVHDADILCDVRGGYCEISGPDLKLLLLLRAAAIPNQIVCTGQYAGVGPSAADDTRSATAASEQCAPWLEHTRELGVCELPVERAEGQRTTIRGFLVPSCGTGQVSLHEVMDNFPEWVWGEWRSSRGQKQEEEDAHANPFTDPASWNGAMSFLGGGGGGGNGGRAASISAVVRAPSLPMVQASHMQMAAAPELPGCAVDFIEARQVAYAVASLYSTSGRLTGSGDTPESEGMAIQKLRELTGMASFFLLAYRIVLSPVEPNAQKYIIMKLATAHGIGPDNYAIALAARCTRVIHQYLAEDPD